MHDCPRHPKIAGLPKCSNNDNDVVPWWNPDRHNMNSFGFNANGFLYDFSTNERMRFMMSYHAMWDGIDDASFTEMLKTNLH